MTSDGERPTAAGEERDAPLGAPLGAPSGEAAAADWLRHMRRGDFTAAWAVADRLLAAGALRNDPRCPRHLQAVWDGTPVAGRRVLVRCHHGLDDTIQFARFLPPLRVVARDVVVWAQPALLPLLATVPDVGRLLPLHDGAPDAAWDVDVEIMELGHLFRVTPATLGPVPYLRVPPVDAARPPDGPLAVGLVWQAGGWDDRRSVPVAQLAPLAAVPGVALHLLQRGPAPAERPAGFGVPAGDDDVLETARVMCALDLVVTVDSMPSHLAGALGVPVWTLLHADADWRWMTGRTRTPWYPSMRLFRQRRPGDWASVVQRVAAALAGLAGRRAVARRGRRAIV